MLNAFSWEAAESGGEVRGRHGPSLGAMGARRAARASLGAHHVRLRGEGSPRRAVAPKVCTEPNDGFTHKRAPQTDEKSHLILIVCSEWKNGAASSLFADPLPLTGELLARLGEGVAVAL